MKRAMPAANNMCAPVDTIILVGGFGTCAYLQNRIKKEFRNAHYIIPINPQYAVASGPVLYVKDTSRVKSTRANITYGIRGSLTFDPLVHDVQNQVQGTEGDFCNNIFITIVKKDEIFKGKLMKLS